MPVARPLLIYVDQDDPVVEQTLLEFLTDLGHAAAPIGSDDELRAKLETTSPKPDVVITTLSPPDLDGFQLLRETHQRYPEIALVLRSHSVSNESKVTNLVKSCVDGPYGVHAVGHMARHSHIEPMGLVNNDNKLVSK